MSKTAAIFDTEGPKLSPDEKAFFRDADPIGFILFADHCETREAAYALTNDLKDCLGRDDVLILIDQEGGRVTRLKPPEAEALDPPARLGELHKLDPSKAQDAAHLMGSILARQVAECGVNVNCVPMLDVPQIDSDPKVIGDRALAKHPDIVGFFGRAMADGSIEGGALPVIKHLPGHGRSLVDSHDELPRVSASKDDLESVDFAPFRTLNDALIGMTAHIVYDELDPDDMATMSSEVISATIRSSIGFDGLLLSDDLRMGAIGGAVGPRAERALNAGCDVALCCNFTMAEKIDTMKGDVSFRPDGRRRLERATDAVQHLPPVKFGDPAFTAMLAQDVSRLKNLLKPVALV